MILPVIQLLTFAAAGILTYLFIHYLSSNEPKCNAAPCLNQGNCTNLNNGGFLCECPPGFNGTLCESKLKVIVYINQCSQCSETFFHVHVPIFIHVYSIYIKLDPFVT